MEWCRNRGWGTCRPLVLPDSRTRRGSRGVAASSECELLRLTPAGPSTLLLAFGTAARTALSGALALCYDGSRDAGVVFVEEARLQRRATTG